MTHLNIQDIETFEHPSDFINFIESSPPAYGWEGNPDSKDVRVTPRASMDSERGRNTWAGTNTFQEAIELSRTGWAEGVKNLKKAMDEIGQIETGYKHTFVNDVAGEFPNPARYLSNHPDCMTRRVRTTGMKKPIVDIVFSACRSGMVDTGTINKLGAYICGFIDQLEQSGYRVGLKIWSGIYRNGHSDSGPVRGAFINIKEPDEPLPLNDIAFYIVHPAFQRRLGFAYREIAFTNRSNPRDDTPVMPRDYGRSATAPRELCPDGSIIFGRVLGTMSNSECRKLFMDTIKHQRPDLIDTSGT